MLRRRRLPLPGVAVALALLVFTAGAAWAYERTVSGATSHSGSQYWSVGSDVTYGGYQDSGGYYNYSWSTSPPAVSLTLSAGTGYSNATAYYRAVIYQPASSNLIIWDSSAANQMDGDTINGNSGDTKYWSPPPGDGPQDAQVDSGLAFVCETASSANGTGASYSNTQCLGFSDTPADCGSYP